MTIVQNNLISYSAPRRAFIVCTSRLPPDKSNKGTVGLKVMAEKIQPGCISV